MPWVRKPAVAPTVPSGAAPAAPDQVVALQPVTIQAALAAGAKPGDVMAAPLAPATGPITVNVADIVPATKVTLEDGSTITTPAKSPLVVVAVQAFWQSKTIIWLRRLVIAAFGVAFVVAFEPYVLGAKTWDTFTLAEGWKTFVHAWEVAILCALFAAFKVRDNNPIQGSTKKGDQ